MAPLGEPLNHHETPGRQTKQSNQLSLPHQDDCNTRSRNIKADHYRPTSETPLLWRFAGGPMMTHDCILAGWWADDDPRLYTGW